MSASDKILERVRALLAIAEHPNTPVHEADTALTQANRLMAKHAIEEATLRAGQTREERRAIESRIVRLTDGNEYEIHSHLRTIASWCAQANRVSAVLLPSSRIELFGMHDDLVWVEQLYTQIYFDFISKFGSRWDTRQTYEANVYRLKNAGLKWKEINELSVANGGPDFREFETRVYSGETLPTGKIKGGMIVAYKREIKRRQNAGEDVQVVAAVNPSQYRRDFADGFTARIANRLAAMGNDARDEARGSGAELVLSDLKAETREALYEAHPNLRPMSAAEQRALEEAARKERNDMLDAMTEKQRYEFLEKERKQNERNARASRRYLDQQDKKTSWAGREAGRSAANSVQINRNAGAASSPDSKGQLEN